ncbi:hypothetical protein B0J14DRAFT_564387 [Halenospora varia]|nr:hypothetical protein B0J14DRAFT_564387 [Halenospora varia]
MLSLLAESWTWYAFAILVAVARYISRWVQLRSIKRFQPEDYVMVLVLVFYTALVAAMNVVSHLDSNLILPKDIPLLTPDSIRSRVRGSKYVLVVEQSMIMTIWGCKICLLLMYNKLTFGLKQHLAVKIVGVYVVGNLILMEVLYFGVWCRPFNQYWAVPAANEQCSTALHHLITNAVFNITSDIMMLCIPLPLLINSQLPRPKKLILCGLFSLGVFVILCAVLNKYYSFAHPFAPEWTFWYIREASTAVLVANMPMCWALMRRVFNLASFNGSGHSRSKSKSLPLSAMNNGIGGTHNSKKPSIFSKTDDENASRSRPSISQKRDKSWFDRESSMSRLGRSESEEFIVNPGKAVMPMEVWETKEIAVDRGSVRAFPTASEHSESGFDKKMQLKRMYDGAGSGKGQYETRTIVTAQLTPEKSRSSESSRGKEFKE